MRLFLLVLLLAFATPSVQAQQTVVVGAALPQTGLLADLAADLRKALLLWQDERNAAGGLLGRRIELQLLDDRSESSAAPRLYEQLIREHRAELLIGPFGSAASLGAAATAERGRRVLVNATGAARVVHRAGYRYVFQVPAPLAGYGRGALEAARALGLRRVLLLARADPAARESAARAREQAAALGLVAGEVEVYGEHADDFAPQVAKARAAEVEAWIAFGQVQDAVTMVQSLRRLDYAPRLFVAQGAADPAFTRRAGQDAEFVMGISPYERSAATRGNAQFAQAFAAKWSAEPGLLAAEGYAAAKVLEEAVLRAGALEQDKLRDALSALETETPLGGYKVDRSGAQVAAQPLLVQIVNGRREIVWPEALATVKWQPFPAWQGRKLLR
jgi:branched-chain amino acid transport system substrate-binding protein